LTVPVCTIIDEVPLLTKYLHLSESSTGGGDKGSAGNYHQMVW